MAENGDSTSDVSEEVGDIKRRLDRLESDHGDLKDSVDSIKTKFEEGSVAQPKKVGSSNDVVGPSIPMKNLRAMFGN